MYLLITIAVIVGVYVVSFKDNFNKEQIDKVALFLVLVGIAVATLFILGAIFIKH